MKTHSISHSKDVDGLSAAALVVAARGATFRLTSYEGLFDALETVPHGVEEVVISDLGTDPTRIDGFVERLEKLSNETGVVYIDHHFLDVDSKKRIREAGVRLVHDERDCAGMLVYQTFRAELPAEAKLVALYAAVTDYMDNSARAKKMMERFDRQLVLFEATMLSHALSWKGDDYAFLKKVVKDLAVMRRPHSMAGVPGYASEQVGAMQALEGVVGESATKLAKLAYVKTKERSTGNVAKMLLGVFDVSVGVAFKDGRNGICEVSLRGTSECKIHLGQEISKIAGKLGGNGGGHALAAGCTVPRESMDIALRSLDGLL